MCILNTSLCCLFYMMKKKKEATVTSDPQTPFKFPPCKNSWSTSNDHYILTFLHVNQKEAYI